MKKKIILIITSLLLSIFLGEAGKLLYKSKMESRMYNTGFYYLSKVPLSEKHESDTFLIPSIIYLFHKEITPRGFKKIFEFIPVFTFFILILYLSYHFNFFVSLFISLMILFSPLILIQYTWIGFQDSLTFLFSILFLFGLESFKSNYQNYIYLFMIILLGSFNHFYQFGIILFNIFLVYCFFYKKIEYKFILLVLASFLVSRGISLFLFYINGVPIIDNRIYVLKAISFEEWLKIGLTNPFFTVFSFFNGLIILLIENLFRRSFVLIFIFLICLVISFFTYDSTRVFVSLFYPAWIILLILRLKEKEFNFKEKILFSTILFISFIYLILNQLYYVVGGKVIYLN